MTVDSLQYSKYSFFDGNLFYLNKVGTSRFKKLLGQANNKLCHLEWLGIDEQYTAGRTS